jgi:hypothetical protein
LLVLHHIVVWLALLLQVSPHELRALLRDLDGIIDSLTDNSIAASRERRDSLIHMNTAATMEKRRPGPDGEIHDYTPLKTFLEKVRIWFSFSDN